MNKKKITIIDYGCGNIFSLKRTINKFDYNVEFTKDPDKIVNSEKIFLPGVGAFKTGIDNLKKNNLDEAIRLFLKKGNFLLGICLGMQLLMDKSEEFGNYLGLGLISGDVSKLGKINNYPIPHIGWTQIHKQHSSNDNIYLLKSIKDQSYFYFIHSYQVIKKKKNETLSLSSYGNNYFSSIVNSDNIFGTQFHPEKSGKVGEKLVFNFLQM